MTFVSKVDTFSKEETYGVGVRRPWYTYITVEPSLFFYMMAYMITNVVEQNFYVFRACTVNHGFSEDVCYNISNYEDVNKEVQEKTVATFQQWFGVANHTVPFVLAFFMGAYSDKRGRKSIILAGLLGKLYFSAMITYITTNDWPVEYVLYAGVFPSSLTGADLAIFAGCFAYIADVSSLKERTFRVGVLDVAYLATLPSGVYIGKLLYNGVFYRNYTAMFAVNTCLMVIATLHCLIFLKWQTRGEQQSLGEAGVTNPIIDFFDIGHVKQTLLTLSKKRSNHKRLFLWLLLISMALYTFQRDERPTMYLYTTVMFKWDVSTYSNFRTYLSSVYVVVLLVGIPLMTKVLHWKDTIIVMMGAVSHIAGHLTYALATEGKTMYVGATVAALGPIVAPLIRAMTSKVLPPAEKGVAYTFLSVMENAVAIFASICYSQLYKATIHTDYPNAIFFLTTASLVLVFLFALVMEIMLRGRRLENIVEQDDRRISKIT